MERCTFIGHVAVGTFTGAHVGRAEPARKVYRIGILSLRPVSENLGPTPRSPFMKALLQGLREVGYVYGRDFVTEGRGGEGRPDRFRERVAQIIGLRVDVILAPGPALPALKQATSTIPVIMAATLDPCATARPKARTSRHQLHGLQPSVARDNWKATSTTYSGARQSSSTRFSRARSRPTCPSNSGPSSSWSSTSKPRRRSAWRSHCRSWYEPIRYSNSGASSFLLVAATILAAPVAAQAQPWDRVAR